MSEEAVISSEMETTVVNSDKLEKSALNFSISRLLSGAADRQNNTGRRNKINNSSSKNNNNNVSNNHHHEHKKHHHTIHHRSNHHDSGNHHHVTRHHENDEINQNNGPGESDSSEEVDIHHNSDSDIEMDDPEDGNRSGSTSKLDDDHHENDNIENHKGRSESPHSRGDQECGTTNSNRSTPDSPHQALRNYHLHQLAQQHESHLTSSSPYNTSGLEGFGSGANGAHGGSVNPFPMLGYSSIFLPNFPCPLTSPPNQVIRVPAHRPMSNFQLFGQSGLGHHNPLDLNASPLFSSFDPRSSLLLKDRLNGKLSMRINNFNSIHYIII